MTSTACASPTSTTNARVVLMRTTILLLALLTSLSACAGSADTGDDAGGVDVVESTTTTQAREAIPLASDALSATGVEVYTQWQSCMAVSWKYAAFGQIIAPEGDVAEQLDSIRTALLDAGYDDVTQVDGHVSMERDGITFDIQQPGAAYGPGKWQVSISSACAGYRGDDKTRVEDDSPQPLEGLAP